MDLNKLLNDLSDKYYTDVQITLTDEDSNTKTLDLHKNVLASSSIFFDKLFKFNNNKNKTNYDVHVENIDVAMDIIMSFYGKEIEYESEYYKLLLYICRDFFGLKNNTYDLLEIKLSPEIVYHYLNICNSIPGFFENDILILKILKNLPDDCDFNLLPYNFVVSLRKFRQYLYYIGMNNEIGKINTDNYDKTSLRYFGNFNTFYRIAVSPCSAYYVFGDAYGTIYIHDRPSNSIVLKKRSHYNKINDIKYSPDGSMIASCCERGNLGLWDAEKFKLIDIWEINEGEIFTLEFHQNNKNIFYASTHGIVGCFDIESETSHILFKQKNKYVKSLALSNNQSLIAIGCVAEIESVIIYDLYKKKIVNSLPTDETYQQYINTYDKNINIDDIKTSKITCLVFSLDDKYLFAGDATGNLYVWHVPTWSLINVIYNDNLSLFDLKLTMDGTQLVSIYERGTMDYVYFWKIDDLKVHHNNLNNLVFSGGIKDMHYCKAISCPKYNLLDDRKAITCPKYNLLDGKIKDYLAMNQ